MTERARKANGLKEKYLLNMLDGQTTYINIWIYTYLCTYNTIIHILYTHIYIQQKGVQRVITYIYNGRPQPACRHKAIVVMRRMGALDCLHDVTIYVYIYICIYICMYVCMYIYIYTQTYWFNTVTDKVQRCYEYYLCTLYKCTL